MKLKDSSKNINLGFTLIELLVSLLVISILIVLGYANFRKYSQKQALWAVARQIEGDLRLAQSYAMAGKDASNCINNNNNYLIGYSLARKDNSYYKIEGICRYGSSFEVVARSISGFEICANFPPVLFKSVSGGVETNNNIIVKRDCAVTSTPYIVISILTTGIISLSYNE